jgi:hypothetical protein
MRLEIYGEFRRRPFRHGGGRIYSSPLLFHPTFYLAKRWGRTEEDKGRLWQLDVKRCGLELELLNQEYL